MSDHPPTPLTEAILAKNPFDQFGRWFEHACASPAIIDPNAMCLSTVDPSGYPDSRMVLLKEVDERGFVFFTNLTSVKGRQLAATPKAALTFFWDPLRRQVRVVGNVAPCTPEEADRYFQSRPRRSQIGAWASKQSTPLKNRETLLESVATREREFEGKNVPRPPHWSGFRVIPRRFEFWQEGENRLHDRFIFTPSGGAWEVNRLYP